MKFSLSPVLLLPALLPRALALPIANETSFLYDAIIVGGGPSGLAALSALGRVRRNVLLIDSGEYRNAPTRHMHDVIGFDGVTPAWYRYAARKQIESYKTVSAVNGTVTKIEGSDADNFVVSYTCGATDETATAAATTTNTTARARKIVLATGLRDIIPSTPGLEEIWGKGLYWCPWCDGNEHADQALGLLGNLSAVPGLVREVLTLNTDLVALVNGTDTPENRAATEAESPGFQDFLDLHNVTVENRTIARVTRLRDASEDEAGGHPADPSLPTAPERDLFRVDFADGGEPLQRAAFFASFPDEQRSPLGADAGVALWGGRLAADVSRGLATNVGGVYAIGDANSDNSTNVPHALYTGKRTAVFLHVRLAKEDQARETGVDLAALLRRGGGGHPDEEEEEELLEQRSVWDLANGPPGEILYAGEFDQ